MTKLIWNILGGVCVFLGILGVILPLLPTTPFVLLAAFCFARGSDVFHDWLLNHKVFGPIISDWNNHGVVSRKAKTSAIIFMAFAVGLAVYFNVPAFVLIIQIAILSGVAIFLLTRPSSAEDLAEDSNE
ncbi:YbaN family protein [Kordiimonas sp. SCSIO 12610]|uniref:YbaN family protein n=1 Tax=Kordiimonas sp. SCSIO 12610 TaxID=2829597 RepID=UPI00210C4846|nr:YbaN family protein [Kordiimonas sp. SCSIO 12610]UTW55753.1 YbaN family protein [Kordiimonas sp. SCSIO 12610]